MSVVHIYQFCRAFDNVRYSEVYGCYVSGGYAFEKIARASHEVPPEIREAVINDYFKLNDNYPPETGDFALIAREIDDKYSVLAVANRQLDDGGRPTIGYKYFWLEKSSSDVDGIGTLIYWWLNQNQPKFDMAELDKQLSQSPQIFRVHEQYKKLIFEEDQLQNIKRIVVEENKIPYTVVVTKELWRKRYPEYTKLHYLALCFSDRATRLNAWAWNVHKIAYPERFLAIFYATQEDIPKNISKQPLPSPQKDNSNTSVSTPTKENTTQTVPVQKIKKCLKDIARIFADTDELDSKKTEELFEYLAKYPNENWSDFIDKTTLQAIHDKFTLIYKAEIYLLLPKEKSSFLIEILNSTNFGNSSGKSTSNSIAIEFHAQLLNASYKYQNEQIIKRLVFSIYTGISYLLNHLMADDNGSNQIEFLLTQSKSIWSKTFLKYAEQVKKRIFSEEEIIVEESLETFCQKILTILQEPKNITLAERKQYEKLVSTFIKINHYPLAGTFCYISDRFIPQDILHLIDNEIYRKIQNIELSSQDKSNSNNEHKNSEAIDNKSENNRSQKKQKLPGKTTTPKRPKRRREINNRIWFILFGIFLVIVVVFVTAIIILIISRNPAPNNNNQDQSHIQNIRKNEKENNSPVNNLENPSANSTTLSTSNTSSGCATDLLSNLEVFKACNETDKDKLKVELRNELHGRYNLFSTEIGEELRQYYLDSKNNDQFQKRKLEIEKCQKDHPITDTSNNDKRGDCIKGTIDKSKQPKKR